MVRELYVSENLDGLCLKLQKIGVGISFFQYSITPTLHRMLSLTESWRARFQGTNQSQVLWSGFLTNFHPLQSMQVNEAYHSLLAVGFDNCSRMPSSFSSSLPYPAQSPSCKYSLALL